MSKNTLRGVALAFAPLVALACAEDVPDATAPQLSAALDVQTSAVEQFLVCKTGTDATFEVSVDGGTPVTVSVSDGQCEVVATHPGGEAVAKWVEVTELSDPGYTLVGTVAQMWTAEGIYSETNGTSPTVSGAIGTGYGWSVSFTNAPTVTPPPPPSGGEGCTPGYWKQDQHADSWVGYSPDQLFSSVFADVFPGMTLSEVVGLNGGGVKALGRHAVAALLNASSGGVAYDLSVQDVIDGFNAAVAGTPADIEAQKNVFEAFNELGCALN
jgi:hypothetical protein